MHVLKYNPSLSYFAFSEAVLRAMVRARVRCPRSSTAAAAVDRVACPQAREVIFVHDQLELQRAGHARAAVPRWYIVTERDGEQRQQQHGRAAPATHADARALSHGGLMFGAAGAESPAASAERTGGVFNGMVAMASAAGAGGRPL